MKINIIILEDEAQTARRLQRMIGEYDPEIKIVAILESIQESLEWLKDHPVPDLAFFDIQLADGESFTLFEKTDIRFPVIFTTAYDQYAIKAFKVNSIDYLLKPVNKEDLENALDKYARLHKATVTPQVDYSKLVEMIAGKEKAWLSRMMIRLGATIKSIEIEDIAYFYIEERIAFAVMKDGTRYPLDQSLEKLEPQLDPKRFFRINRQFLISFDSINKMYMYSKARIKVTLKPPSDIEAISSAERSPLFRDWLDGK